MPPQKGPAVASGPLPRLGYLLKQAHLGYTELASAVLAPLEVTPREWAALLCFGHEAGRSQGEVAQLLGVDRTSMVALVDELQAKGLVIREPQPDDRRKNRVDLTVIGRDVMERGAQLADEMERHFLAVLGEQDAQRLKRLLHAVIGAQPALSGGPAASRDTALSEVSARSSRRGSDSPPPTHRR